MHGMLTKISIMGVKCECGIHKINNSQKSTLRSALMKCTDSILNYKLICLQMFVIASRLIKPFPFASVLFLEILFLK